MKISARTTKFDAEFRILFETRRIIVMDLIERVKAADNLDELCPLGTCDQSKNYYFIFNNICKLFFEHQSDTNSVRLWDFQFYEYGLQKRL